MSDISVSSIRNLIFTTVPGDDDEFYDPCSAAEKIEFAVKRLVANSFDKGQEVGRLYSCDRCRSRGKPCEVDSGSASYAHHDFTFRPCQRCVNDCVHCHWNGYRVQELDTTKRGSVSHALRQSLMLRRADVLAQIGQLELRPSRERRQELAFLHRRCTTLNVQVRNLTYPVQFTDLERLDSARFEGLYGFPKSVYTYNLDRQVMSAEIDEDDTDEEAAEDDNGDEDSEDEEEHQILETPESV